MAFLIADGVIPSNEGRGYVLRRIMRRAMRYGKQLGQEQPFLHAATGLVVDKMSDHYPALEKERRQIELLVEAEEQQFDTTLNKGMPIFVKYLEQFAQEQVTTVPAQVVHFMYGTHGFPVDLMGDIARDHGLELDHEGFRELMEQEAETSQAGGDFNVQKVNPVLEEDSKTFSTAETCHEGLEGRGTVRRLLRDGEGVAALLNGERGEIVLDSTSFYAESGGQIGDRGTIQTATGIFAVEETSKILDRLVVHTGVVREGRLEQGQAAQTNVDRAARIDTMKNHTATHLLHAALREVLGLHVRQAGSLVDPERLRFDFSHFSPVTAAQIEQIEDLVNRQILANVAVQTQVLALEEARNRGAIAFFGEKYGERVRVVSAGDFSMEFCGGTHVNATGEIGCFKIISEKGLAAGVRRLVALTGPKAIARFQESEALLKEAQDRFFMTREGFIEQLQKAQDERKQLERRVEELKMKLAQGGGSAERTESVGEFNVLLKAVCDVQGGQLRQLADELLTKLKDGVVLLGSELEGKAQLLVKTNRKEVHAGKLVGDMAELVGGRGGGRPDMAMAGGKEPAKLQDALEKGLALLEEQCGAG
jgi:alanyl-tRNA synthetase